MRNIIYISVVIISGLSIISNLCVFESYKDQTILLDDLANDKFSISIKDIVKVNHKYPTLAMNSFPLASIKARYFEKYGDFDSALELSKTGINSNPNLADTYYIKARIFISKDDYNKALSELRTAYTITTKKNYISALYFTLLSELNYQKELIDIYDFLKNTNDSETINFYLLALKKVLGENNPFYLSALKNFKIKI